MDQPSRNHEPQLEPPGAGLPKVEAFLSRHVFFPLFSAVTSWDRASAIFAHEGTSILRLVSPLTPERLERRVLIPRITGMEDSSRYWSPAMTVEHLMIVGDKIMAVIMALNRRQAPTGKADVAAVKPTGRMEGDIVENFRQFLGRYATALATESRVSPGRYSHPWFGPLNAKEWHGIGALHQRIHRRQIAAILRS